MAFFLQAMPNLTSLELWKIPSLRCEHFTCAKNLTDVKLRNCTVNQEDARIYFTNLTSLTLENVNGDITDSTIYTLTALTNFDAYDSGEISNNFVVEFNQRKINNF